MKEIKVKYIFGLFFILFHFLIIVEALCFKYNEGLHQRELTTILGIITPVLVGYTTIIVSFFIKDRYRINYDSNIVTPVFVILLFGFTLVFFASIMLSLYFISKKQFFQSFEEFKNMLFFIETILSCGGAALIYSLFPRVSED